MPNYNEAEQPKLIAKGLSSEAAAKVVSTVNVTPTAPEELSLYAARGPVSQAFEPINSQAEFDDRLLFDE